MDHLIATIVVVMVVLTFFAIRMVFKYDEAEGD